MKNLLQLDMSRNKIDQIPERLLDNLNRLKLLSLPRNNISSISSQTFSKLTDLEYLLLNGNRLVRIPNRAFNSLKKLKIVMLSDNQIDLIGSKAFVLSNSSMRIYLIRTAMKAVDIESFEGLQGLSTKISMNEGEIGSLNFNRENGSVQCRVQLGIGQSDQEYIELDDIDEDMKGVLRRVLEQSGFASRTGNYKFLPCPAGTFVNTADKGFTSCSECPPGGFFSDTLAYVSDQCKRCPNGTFVSPDKKPGRRALDCAACPQGTNTSSFSGFRACKCLKGFYRTHLFKGCQACQKDGFLCVDDYVTLKPGFWWMWFNDVFKGIYRNFTLNLRASKPSSDNHLVEYTFDLPLPHECPRKESCLGGLDSACKQGHVGPLCEVCSPGFYKRLQTCKTCPTKTWMGVQLAIIIVLLLILIVVVVWTSLKKNRQSNNQRPLVDIILARLKIVIGFYQVTFGLLNAFSFISWPGSLSVIARYSEILQLNVLQIAPMHCLLPQLKIDAFGSLFFILAMNFGAIVLAVVAYWVRKFMILRNDQLEDDRKSEQVSQTKELIYRNLFFFLFITYLSTCSKTANVLPPSCRELCFTDEGYGCFTYLKSDFTVECRSPRYKRLIIVAYLTVVYIFFVPLASFLVLWKKHKKVKVTENESREQPRSTSEIAAGLRFLSENYNGTSWYWELIEMVRKVVLTSGFILIGGESRAYVGLACVISGLYGMLFAYVSPIEDPFENKMMIITLAVTFVNLGIGAVCRIPTENVPASIDPYVDSVMFNFLVVGVNTLVIGLLVVQYSVYLYNFLKEWRKNPKWSMSCCLAMLLPLNDLQGELRGLVGRNVLKQQLQSGRIGMPSVTGAVKDSGAVDFALEESDEESQDSRPQQDNRLSPHISSNSESVSMNDITISALIVHHPQKASSPVHPSNSCLWT
ncbi:uncharacterized protein LOC111331582 isoform X1 [Stylophora pistillata]|uniref:uncharacterized protein LOC111331582 isoform X1 n=1 Tax=Stylophora pistillata TaxID=50429 RepID=UPI000C04DA05|nr:uncharacterized protein LOC111331582 isoform X1 [Stylophora pistillata]